MIIADYTIPGMRIRDHVIAVPLDWSKPDGQTIELFAREVVDPARVSETLPLLCFLQGGPGGKSPRPTVGSPSWLWEAIKTHRVILPDQRGTGRSAPVTGEVIGLFADAGDAADYLALFDANAIVSDFEHLRKTAFAGARWQTLGQSYGGFLTLTYLSRAPEGLSACYIAGGLPGLDAQAEDIYRRTYPRVAAKTERFYKRFPQNVERVAALADLLAEQDVRLPDGDRLTVKRLQTLGLDFGMGSGFENVHWALDEAMTGGSVSTTFLSYVMDSTCFRGNELFAALQEAIYPTAGQPPASAAERIRADFPAFEPEARPLMFTGEMIYPWMFEEVAALRPFRPAVEAMAMRDRQREFYDVARLAANDVPMSAVIYHDDMYVDAGLSLETSAVVGNLDHWVTNEFEHDGLRQSASVFQRLMAMVQQKGGPLAG